MAAQCLSVLLHPSILQGLHLPSLSKARLTSPGPTASPPAPSPQLGRAALTSFTHLNQASFLLGVLCF